MQNEETQELIRTANLEGLGRSNTLTFIFLRSYGKNSLRKTQDELAADSGIQTRTIRAHLSALDEAGWIEYSGTVSGHWDEDGKNIRIKRFKI